MAAQEALGVMAAVMLWQQGHVRGVVWVRGGGCDKGDGRRVDEEGSELIIES